MKTDMQITIEPVDAGFATSHTKTSRKPIGKAAAVAERSAEQEKQRLSKIRLSAAIVRVTPAMAALWSHPLINDRNRVKGASHVGRLLEDIKADRFVISPAGIGFSKNGVLLDGQHRLEAIARGGKSVMLVVCYGLDDEARGVIDGGKARDVADLLRWRHPDMFTDAKRASAIGAAIDGCGMTRSQSKLTKCKFIEDHSDAIRWTMDVFKSRQPGISRASVPAVFARAYYTANRVQVARFANMIETGAHMPSGVAVLRNWLLSFNLAGHAASALAYRLVSYVLNEYLNGRAGRIKSERDLREVTTELYPLPGEAPKKFDVLGVARVRALSKRVRGAKMGMSV